MNESSCGSTFFFEVHKQHFLQVFPQVPIHQDWTFPGTEKSQPQLFLTLFDLLQMELKQFYPHGHLSLSWSHLSCTVSTWILLAAIASRTQSTLSSSVSITFPPSEQLTWSAWKTNKNKIIGDIWTYYEVAKWMVIFKCTLRFFPSFKLCILYWGYSWLMGFPGSSAVKNLSATQEPQETQVQSLGGEAPLEEGEATHSCILI